jgi:hypothetical protein
MIIIAVAPAKIKTTIIVTEQQQQHDVIALCHLVMHCKAF